MTLLSCFKLYHPSYRSYLKKMKKPNDKVIQHKPHTETNIGRRGGGNLWANRRQLSASTYRWWTPMRTGRDPCPIHRTIWTLHPPNRLHAFPRARLSASSQFNKGPYWIIPSESAKGSRVDRLSWQAGRWKAGTWWTLGKRKSKIRRGKESEDGVEFKRIDGQGVTQRNRSYLGKLVELTTEMRLLLVRKIGVLFILCDPTFSDLHFLFKVAVIRHVVFPCFVPFRDNCPFDNRIDGRQYIKRTIVHF